MIPLYITGFPYNFEGWGKYSRRTPMKAQKKLFSPVSDATACGTLTQTRITPEWVRNPTGLGKTLVAMGGSPSGSIAHAARQGL